ncbi:hypothetical protein [Pseudomonas sediminis]|uniref:hypothetical protein n=1 Tax=Pseudomonas sediminis TaxID=1691904 RepID=UPI0031CCC858
MPFKMLLSALFLLLSGCAVYGEGYERGYHQGYRYHDGYRRDHHAPPVYVTPRYYYEDRRHQYYPTPPRHYGHEQRHSGSYKRYDQPRHDYRRDHRRQEYRSGQIQRGWDTGRKTQQRFSNGRSHGDEHRSRGERRW